MLEGTISLGPDHPETALEARRAAQGGPGELFILDQLEVGMALDEAIIASIPLRRGQRSGVPVLAGREAGQDHRAEPWYTPEGAAIDPWGRAIVPFEMLSVLANKSGRGFPVRGPALGLFLDLEVRMVDGPVFADQDYALRRRDRRPQPEPSAPSRTGPRRRSPMPTTGDLVAIVLLHQGVFKESYAGYPKERLGAR